VKALAIDPGLAHVGLALFRFDSLKAISKAHGPLAHLQDAWEIETQADEHPAARLFQIYTILTQTFLDHRPELLIIETPAMGGDYGGQKARRTNTNLLYQALGAINLAAGIHAYLCQLDPDTWIRYQRAPSSRKTKRYRELKAAADTIGIPLPSGPRGGKLPNAWDAIVCGVNCLRQSD
jgi:Holliday junction resolvasome RuvABC endonuclease subunit